MTSEEKRLLAWAYNQAEAWRGCLVGNPDPVPLIKFDQKLSRIRFLLKQPTTKKYESNN